MTDSTQRSNLVFSLIFALVVHAIAICGGILHADAGIVAVGTQHPPPRPRPEPPHTSMQLLLMSKMLDGAPISMEQFTTCRRKATTGNLLRLPLEEFDASFIEKLRSGDCIGMRVADVYIDEFFGVYTMAGQSICFARVLHTRDDEDDPFTITLNANPRRMRIGFSAVPIPRALIPKCVPGERPRHALDRVLMPEIYD